MKNLSLENSQFSPRTENSRRKIKISRKKAEKSVSKSQNPQQLKIKKSRFPLGLFWGIFGMLLLVAGMQIGLVVLSQVLKWPAIASVNVMIFYWIVVSLLIVLYIKRRMHRLYEIPLQKISAATAKVAHGDFSVYIPTTNSANKYDYLDVMIMDLNKMIEELGSIETLKTDFVSNVSHEMKTPIAVIKNSAQLLKLPNITEENRLEYEKNIENAADKLSLLITNILRLNKLENKFILPKKEKFDLTSQLEECILQFESRWEEKNLELDVDLEEKIIIEQDKEMLSLVWNNLISNAIKFSDFGGKLRISSKKNADFVQVEVADFGCGMDEKTLNHIFDKFYQGDSSHSKEGNGLGLALVKRVLVLLGGIINVKSELGKGSTFTVRI